MPWDNQNGGGWQGGGGGNRGPWGQGPSGGGGNQPPDLDELIRRAQEKFRQVFSGGGGAPGGGAGTGTGGGRGPIFLVAIVIVGFLAYSSFFRVNANEKGIVLRFGEHVRTMEPGLHFKFPYPVETVLTPAVTNITSIDIGMRASGGSAISVPEESLMLTGDENIVDISFSVQWRIKASEAPSFLFNVENPDFAVKAVAESMMREAVGFCEPRCCRRRAVTKSRIRFAKACRRRSTNTAVRHRNHGSEAAEGRSARRRCWTRSATCRRRAPTRSVCATRPKPMPTR